MPRSGCLAALAFLGMLAGTSAAPVGAAQDASIGMGESPHAVILVYHHVDDEMPASTSVGPETFERHLDYLHEHGYRVMPLGEIVAALRDDRALPGRAVAFTFDDAYESVHSEALPRLEARRWPFTVFVSTDYIDGDYGGYMSWDQLRDIETRGGTIGNHSATHSHLVRRERGETAQEWRSRVAGDIRRAQARLDAELEAPLRLLAYPYGEFDRELEQIAAELGFIAFGQQSGPAGAVSGLRRLPRFPVASAYADLESLVPKLESRPLPVEVLQPESRILAPQAGPPRLKIRVEPGPYRRQQMRCYVPGQEPARIDWRDDIATVTARRPLRPGRSKFNCTAPSVAVSGVFYWYSHLWLQPMPDGSWYPEH